MGLKIKKLKTTYYTRKGEPLLNDSELNSHMDIISKKLDEVIDAVNKLNGHTK